MPSDAADPVTQPVGLTPGEAQELETWHRLHPLSPVVTGGRAVAVLGVLALARIVGGQNSQGSLITDIVIAALAVVGGIVSWLVTRWRVEGNDLRIETGLIRRDSQRYPLRQLQAIDIVQSGLARVLGLAELRLRMASSSKGRLACLPVADAKRLRGELLALARSQRPAAADASGVEAGAWPDDATAPRRRVLQVPTGQLAVSLLLSPAGLFAVVYLVVGIATSTSAHHGVSGVLGSGIAVVIAVGTGLWRRFNGDYHLTVDTSGHGLELTSGLVQTTTETVPAGRIQALRVVEPLLWRPFGWCRVEASVAGKTTRSENRAQSRGRRALLPVGSYSQAHQVLSLVLPDISMTMSGPPGRARWKAPLSYHRLSVGSNPSCVATTSGRLLRVSHWVPLDKVQSIRRTQGPIQRRLRLATVHLDTAGARMRAALRDRDIDEVEDRLRHLPAACADARAAAH